MLVTLSGGELGGTEVEWKDGLTEMSFDSKGRTLLYRLETDNQAVFEKEI